jgi:hypothetical protein
MSPVFLLTIPTALLTSGREGLWLALLAFVAPLFGLLLASSSPSSESNEKGFFFTLGAVLMMGGLLWANLTLAADIAAWLGGPRWAGTLVGGVTAVALAVWRGSDRARPLFIASALVGTVAPLLMVLGATDPLPHRVWAHVSSQPSFRFRSDSPWVTEGRAIRTRPGGELLFLEEHRLIPLTAGPLRVVISDRGRVREEEWTVTPGQPITLRPGDRITLESATRLRFEGEKRIPGAPLSGIDWADRPLRSPGAALWNFLGLGVTLVGGAVALVALTRRFGDVSRSVASLAGLLLFVVVLWGECWAIYAAAYTPELFLGGVIAPALLELPSLVFFGSWWGQWLSWIVVVGLLSWFLASAAALRESIIALGGQPGEEFLKHPVLWVGLVAAAGLASLWPVAPWSLMLIALGLGASTLSPIILAGRPAGRPAVEKVAVGFGLLLFLGLTAAGRLGMPASEGMRAIFAYPSLVTIPLTAGFLWVARRRA